VSDDSITPDQVQTSTVSARPPLWRDIRVLRIAFQVAVVGAVGALLIYLYDNTQANLRRLDLPSGFSYLDQAAGFVVPGQDFVQSDTVLDAIVAGFRNTITVALTGIVLTLILGTVVGIARLSSNWLVAKAAGIYVETLRNLPPLLVIIFVNTAALSALPPIQDATQLNAPLLGNVMILSVGDNGIMSLGDGGDAGIYLLVLGAGAMVAVGVHRVLLRREDRTGRPQRGVLVASGLLAVIAVTGYLALAGPIVVSNPEVVNLSVEGGFNVPLPFISVLVALVLYTASHVAEIVRGSIQAVPQGQVEAARAIGLSGAQRLRHVVLPQAFRIATPPTINQFLNLAKNTSLGVAVGYAEAMFVTSTAIGNGHPAVQSILVVMGFYLVLSLCISLVANVANRRLQLVER
jgi:general L-amino acid transport system permease protein